MGSSWLRRWEGLRAGTQAAIALPVAAVVMFLLHVGPLNQPLGRAIGYALFWGAVVTIAIVSASRTEKVRRAERDRANKSKDTE